MEANNWSIRHALCALLKDAFDEGLKCSSPEVGSVQFPVAAVWLGTEWC